MEWFWPVIASEEEAEVAENEAEEKDTADVCFKYSKLYCRYAVIYFM